MPINVDVWVGVAIALAFASRRFMLLTGDLSVYLREVANFAFQLGFNELKRYAQDDTRTVAIAPIASLLRGRLVSSLVVPAPSHGYASTWRGLSVP